MSCARYATDIALYAGGDLPASHIPRVELHLRECAACRALAGELRADRAMLGELRDEPLEDAIVEQVHRRVLDRVSGAGFSRRWAFVPALALAAALLLAVVLLWPRHAAQPAPVTRVARVEPPPVIPAPPTNIVPVRHRVIRRRRKQQPAAQSGPPLLVQFVTDDPNIVIYWLVDQKPQGD